MSTNNLKTKKGKHFWVPDWVISRMRFNHALGRDILEQTPIGVKMDGQYFWVETETRFKDLDKRSVTNLKKSIK